MAPQIERLSENNFTLGEGPHWDPATQTLYFLDCREQLILRYNPATKKISKVSTAPNRVSFIIPVEGKKDQFIISLDKDLVIISWDGASDKYSIIEKLGTVDEPDGNKFNDGKCDSLGRLWSGTSDIVEHDIDQTQPVGTLYSLDSKRQLKGHVNQVRISNGLAFNDKAKKLFYIDSMKRSVDRFDFDITTGTITNREAWFTLDKHDIPGVPDGMTIDAEGNLWVAVFGGARVLKVDGTHSETLLDTVKMPALQITSAAFGGPNFDELYVTSACLEHGDQKLEKPTNGALYKVTGTGSRGLPANNFKLN